MKNKLLLFICTWSLHILLYYPSVFIIGYKKGGIFKSNLDISDLLLSPIPGIIGFIDGLPFFVFLSIFIMWILVNTYFKKKWFFAYYFSLIPLYPVAYFVGIYVNNDSPFLQSLSSLYYDSQFVINTLSLIIAIMANWFIFRNAYLQIKEGS